MLERRGGRRGGGRRLLRLHHFTMTPHLLMTHSIMAHRAVIHGAVRWGRSLRLRGGGMLLHHLTMAHHLFMAHPAMTHSRRRAPAQQGDRRQHRKYRNTHNSTPLLFSRRVAGEHVAPGVCVKCHNIKRFTLHVRSFHTRRPDWHARHGKASDTSGAFGQETLNIRDRHMTFYDEAIDQGGVAGNEIVRDAEPAFQGWHVGFIRHGHTELSRLPHSLDPTATAAAACVAPHAKLALARRGGAGGKRRHSERAQGQCAPA
jgi:hypothetical protein